VKHVGRLPVAGADLFYETEGSGTPVVLIHGFSLDTRMWDPQMPALRDIATLIRVDLRGFGRSTMPAPGIAYSHGGDVLRLLDHLSIASAVVVGLSMGGLVALHLALIAPERVRALVLLDSVLDAVPWDPVSERAMMAPEHIAATEGVDAAKRLWLEHPFFTPARRDPQLAARLTELVEPYSCFHWTHKDPREPLRPSPHAQLEHIAVPATVVIGALDVPCFHAMAEQLSRRIPGARLITVPDAGHMVNLEAVDAVNTILREAVEPHQGQFPAVGADHCVVTADD
jgi:3-oxoadipate enol-lactonase